MLALAKVDSGPGHLELVTRPEPTPAPDELLIEIAGCGICGSDLHLYHGTMRLIPQSYPLWLGHEYAGTICGVGGEVIGWQVGDRVTAEPSTGCGRCASCQHGYPNVCPERRFTAGGFSKFVTVAAQRVHRLPESLDLQTATLCEPLACVVHGVLEQATVIAGDVCVVIGPGPIGLLAALVAQAEGATVVLLGRESSFRRLQLAEELGIKHVVNTSRHDPCERVKALTRGYGAEVVFGCAGTEAAVELALELVGRRGRYTELALFGGKINLDFEQVLVKEIKVTGAMSHRTSAWRRALTLIESGGLPAELLAPLITTTYALTDWKKGFEAAASKRDVKVVLDPS